MYQILISFHPYFLERSVQFFNQFSYLKKYFSVQYFSQLSPPSSKPITSKYIQQLFSQTWNVPCRIDFQDNGMLMPGDHGAIRLTLLKKMVMNNGQPFTIRENGNFSFLINIERFDSKTSSFSGATVATGIVTKIHPSVDLPLNKLSKLVLAS